MNTPYKIIMSKGEPIKIDSDELDKIIKGLVEGGIVVTRSGIFNPSFYVSIIKDDDRYKRFIEDIKYNDDIKELRKVGCKKLENIFKNIDVLKLNTNKS